MDQREALERLAAADHAGYVVERAQAAVAGCDEKVEKIQRLLEAAEDDARAARAALDDAEEQFEAAAAAGDEVPMDLRSYVMTHRPDIASAHAGPAVASGGAS